MAQLIIPTPLRKFTNDSAVFRGSGATVRELLGELVETHQGLKPHLLDEGGNLRSFIRVYVGEDDIHSLQGEDTPIHGESTVSIIPAIAGGV